MNKAATETRVLGVGNCDPDHGKLADFLSTHFSVRLDRASTTAEAIGSMRQHKYALVLFNRVVFDDGTDGMELLRLARKEPTQTPTPMMMISNYDWAQQAAIAAGAEPGFGKSEWDDPATVHRLAKYL